jgi:predicted ribosome quality control (RQC) complex YloA/Tae2 family protein
VIKSDKEKIVMTDNIILEALTAEWKTRLNGAGIGKIYYYREHGYFFQLFNCPDKFLHISLSGLGFGCRLLRERPEYPSEINSMLLILRKHIEGAFVRDIAKPENERILTVTLGKSRLGKMQEQKLICEMTGKRGNLYLTGAEGEISGLDHPVKRVERTLDVGTDYKPPAKPAKASYDEISRDDFIKLCAQAKSAESSIDNYLSRSLFGLGSLLAKEVAYHLDKSEQEAWSCLELIRETGKKRKYKPTIYNPDAEENGEANPLSHVVYPMKHLSDYKPVHYQSVSDALTVLYEDWARGFQEELVKRGLSAFLRREKKKAGKLLANLRRDLERFHDYQQYKLWGELILSNLHSGVKGKDFIEVVNLYSENQEKIRIPLNPAIPLNNNADKYFRMYKKYKRGEVTVRRRIRQSEKKLEELAELAERLDKAGMDEMTEISGLLVKYGFKKVRVGKKGKKGAPPRIPFRTFISSEGYEILVGKGAKDNDELTFKNSRDNDFWLHAAGSPGSHVVIRNRDKLDKCPARTLDEAASLAAFFSKQKSSTKVQIHYTLRKHVRRIKGAPPGTVRIQSYMGLLAAPVIPKGIKRVDEE